MHGSAFSLYSCWIASRLGRCVYFAAAVLAHVWRADSARSSTVSSCAFATPLVRALRQFGAHSLVPGAPAPPALFHAEPCGFHVVSYMEPIPSCERGDVTVGWPFHRLCNACGPELFGDVNMSLSVCVCLVAFGRGRAWGLFSADIFAAQRWRSSIGELVLFIAARPAESLRRGAIGVSGAVWGRRASFAIGKVLNFVAIVRWVMNDRTAR